MWADVLGGVVYATLPEGPSGSSVALVGVAFHKGDVVMVDELRGGVRRRKGTGDSPDRVGVPPDVWSRYPCLWSFLSVPWWDDGSPRLLGTVTLFRDAGRLKAAFNDKESGEVGFTTLDETVDVLGALEGALRDDAVDWRRSSPRPRAK